MLIDLGRNDVGRISQPGSVEVTEKMVVERYSHVMHITSNVVGQVNAGMSAIDVLKATLPAGTLSGAPKIRAMEIIDELEPGEAKYLWRRRGLHWLEWQYGYGYCDPHRGYQRQDVTCPGWRWCCCRFSP